ncbi:MAG TPA: M3 family metallopeptidase [Candidatus Paceibacterota bacterium]|nr:M3 family metallopeptidase [Candidatus Paceibacterota bacterium]
MQETTPKNLKTDSYRWDLSPMYQGIADPQIDRDVEELIRLFEKFNYDHKGKLDQSLGQAIKDFIKIDLLETKIMVYLHLLESLDVTAAPVKTKSASVEVKLSKTSGEYMAFFEIELVALEDKVLEDWYAKDEIVAKHRPWIEYHRIFKDHLLTESVEAALAKRSPFGPSSWDEFFNEVEADLRLKYKDQELNLTEALETMTNSLNADERAEILKIIHETLSGHFSKYSAQNLYMVTGADAVEDKERKYRHPMEARNKGNRIPDAVVDALHRAVTEVAAPLARRYYQLKAAHLGMKTLKWSDRNAPLPFHDTTTIPFDEALKTVLAAYQSFSPTLAEMVKIMIDQKRIDAPAIKGKHSGAFNSSFVLPGNIPASFTLLNYLGSQRDVSTLAHELGHAVHGILCGQAQGPLMSNPPIAYCETASVFGEMVTFNFLKEQLADKADVKAELGMLMSKIEDDINTVVRQISFSNFERRIHGMDDKYQLWGEAKKHSVQELDAIWLQVTKEFYGQDGEIFTYENADHLWSYVDHFHRPFYVYGYAFGQLLTHSLYAQQERLGDKFEPLYLDLLRAGSTKDAVELLKPFGLDPTKEEFWVDGINAGIGTMLKEAEELSAKVGIKI